MNSKTPRFLCSLQAGRDGLQGHVSSALARAVEIVRDPDHHVSNRATDEHLPQFIWVASDYEEQVELTGGLLKITTIVGNATSKGRIPVPEMPHGRSSGGPVTALLQSVSDALRRHAEDRENVERVRERCRDIAIVSHMLASTDAIEARAAPMGTAREPRLLIRRLQQGRLSFDNEPKEALKKLVEALPAAFSLDDGIFGEDWRVSQLFVDSEGGMDPVRHARLVRAYCAHPEFGPIIADAMS